MTDKLTYKDFIGAVHFSTENSVFCGKIEGTNNLVSFEGESVSQLKLTFEEAIDDYINLCKEIHKEPLKSFKGSSMSELNPNYTQKLLNLQ